uniref:Uncharacterized protein LOC105634861 isoform X1 n=1 Tax=Rhizophora mucronata TaxID=61149 RepID=A0A2P2LX33_RHIMU
MMIQFVYTPVNLGAFFRLQQLKGSFNSNQHSNALYLLLNLTYAPLPRCLQENPPFQREELAEGMACCSQVNCHMFHSNCSKAIIF